MVDLQNNFDLEDTIEIDLSRLPILFSQYGSFDDTQESISFQGWTFSCSHTLSFN